MKNVPPGYTVPVGMASKERPRVAPLGSARAIERGGGAPGAFIPAGQHHQVTPMYTPGMRLGAVRLANPDVVRQPSVLGQNGNDVTMGPPTQPPPDVPTEEPTTRRPWEPGEKGKRLAWGKFKKKDAEELAAFLAEIESRMDELNVPAGIVKQIRLKLETFTASNVPPEAEVTITEEEAKQLDAAIFSLEVAEKDQPPSFATAAAVVAGLGLLSVAILG